MLQAATRNPLADPGILGINGGAAAAIVTAIVVLGTQQLSDVRLVRVPRRRLSPSVIVYTIASLGREGATPGEARAGRRGRDRGVLLAHLRHSCMTDVDALNELRFWQVGSLAGRYLPRALADPAVHR